MRASFSPSGFCLLLSFCFSGWISLSAQNTYDKFGQISSEELMMKICPVDSSAEAYVLYDKGKSVFESMSDGGFEIIYDRQCRIKILNENGYGYADIGILLYQENNIYERLESIEAYTYNLNGNQIERTPLDSKNIFLEKVSESLVRKKFAFPKVKAGSIIEYRYRVSTPYLFNLPSWRFQWEIPVKYSEYEVHMIPFYTYTYILQGASKFQVFSSEESKSLPRSYAGVNFNDLIYIYGMRDLPAFRPESYINCPSDYLVKLIFQLSTVYQINGSKNDVVSTWNQLEKDIIKSEYFGRFLKSANTAAKKLIEELNLNGLSIEDKAKVIVDYMKSNYKWDEVTTIYTDKSVKKFLADKSGNSTEINLFLVAMLNAAGIESYPLMLSTRDHGRIRYQYPFIHYFNNVIVASRIGKDYTFNDGTASRCSYSHIPVECINEKGLIIKKEDPIEWIALTNDAPSLIREDLNLSIENYQVNCRLKLKATEYDAYDYYESFFSKPETVENRFLKRGYSSADSIVMDPKPESIDTFQLNLNLSYKLDNSGEFLYLSPLLQEPVLKSPFKSPERTYPIDFTYLQKREYQSNITIPEGYSVQSVPAKLYYDNKDYTVFYESKTSGKDIRVNAYYMFKRTVFQAAEYHTIRFIMQSIVDKFNEKIVLKKI